MVAGERVTVKFQFIEFREAVAYLELPYLSFNRIASRLPYHAITPARFGYLRRVLLEHSEVRLP